jgi:hypothetical protein
MKRNKKLMQPLVLNKQSIATLYSAIDVQNTNDPAEKLMLSGVSCKVRSFAQMPCDEFGPPPKPGTMAAATKVFCTITPGCH